MNSPVCLFRCRIFLTALRVMFARLSVLLYARFFGLVAVLIFIGNATGPAAVPESDCQKIALDFLTNSFACSRRELVDATVVTIATVHGSAVEVSK